MELTKVWNLKGFFNARQIYLAKNRKKKNILIFLDYIFNFIITFLGTILCACCIALSLAYKLDDISYA